MPHRFIVFGMVLCGLVPSSYAQSVGAVRPEHADVREMIAEGAARSATFKGLIERLNGTGLVVYIRFGPCAGGVAACTRLVARQGDTRRLLIAVDRFGRAPWDLITLLAHELQHALEIAEQPTIVDGASFRQFYAANGRRHSAGYETAAAIAVAQAVSSELWDRTQH